MGLRVKVVKQIGVKMNTLSTFTISFGTGLNGLPNNGQGRKNIGNRAGRNINPILRFDSFTYCPVDRIFLLF